MGAAGAYMKTGTLSSLIPGIPVKAADTTAAGDIFNGALAVAVSEGMMIDEAVRFANRAASISVTRYRESKIPFLSRPKSLKYARSRARQRGKGFQFSPD